MSSKDLTLPTKACHNCRKRRWKCDRSLPVCQKCLSSGTECLGYGKLFVWNRGVASRGKMMGKTYGEGLEPQEEGHAHETTVEESWSSNVGTGHPDWMDTWPTENQRQHGAEDVDLTLQWPLVDPLLQDLSQHSRYYLFHFATQLCSDMVVYDRPGQNPFRDIIPATSAHPLLLQIIFANSAHHIFNISRDSTSPSNYQENQKPCLVAYYQSVTRFGGPFKSSYHDALVAKQQALSLLAQSVASVNASNIDLILLTILLFINYDLIESGRDKWRVHMDGAKRLIKLLGEPPFLQQPMSRLRQCILSDFLVFYILGSTFCFTAMPPLLPSTIELEPILRYAETNNYLSCPGPLLRIMIESFSLQDAREFVSDQVTEHVQEQVRRLLVKALDFDPVAWSCSFEPASPDEKLDQRVRIASAHRSAVCIYLARVLPCSNPLLCASSNTALVSLPALADEIVLHVSQLQPGDALFKSISWPLFLAGAEAVDPIQRVWILDALDRFYNVLYWGYIPTVKRVLETIWNRRDENHCWVDEVQEMGTEILIA